MHPLDRTRRPALASGITPEATSPPRALHPPPVPRIVLLDNRDSFVWNLAQALEVLAGPGSVEVVRSDSTSVDACGFAEALVLSPGPGRPETAGICIDAIRKLHGRMPILGICLGHQAIAIAAGATIEQVPPCHGHAWSIRHRGAGLFGATGIPPSEFPACRYHSLALAPDTLPPEWTVDAETPEGIPMAIRHRRHPTYGLQFHPESFRSPSGSILLEQFLRSNGLLSVTSRPPVPTR